MQLSNMELIILGAIGTVFVITSIMSCIGIWILLIRMQNWKENCDRWKNIEEYLADLSSEVNADPDPSQFVYRSADGKHSANSMEELIQKMQADPSHPLADASPEDIKKLLEEFPDAPQDDDDDEENEQPWRPGRRKTD